MCHTNLYFSKVQRQGGKTERNRAMYTSTIIILTSHIKITFNLSRDFTEWFYSMAASFKDKLHQHGWRGWAEECATVHSSELVVIISCPTFMFGQISEQLTKDRN